MYIQHAYMQFPNFLYNIAVALLLLYSTLVISAISQGHIRCLTFIMLNRPPSYRRTTLRTFNVCNPFPLWRLFNGAPSQSWISLAVGCFHAKLSYRVRPSERSIETDGAYSFRPARNCLSAKNGVRRYWSSVFERFLAHHMSPHIRLREQSSRLP